MTISNVVLVLATVFSATFTFAQSTELLREQIATLSRDIRQESATSQASWESLSKARNLIEEALDLVKGSGAGMSKDCFDFAFAKYFSASSTSVATDKAAAACKIIKDLDVMKFAFQIYFSSSSATAAMDKTILASDASQKGKLDMIRFAYDKYFSASSASVAMDNAVKAVAKVPRGQILCLQNLFAKYFSSSSVKVAMDKAAEGCSE